MAIVALTQQTAPGGAGAALTAVLNSGLNNADTYTFQNDGRTIIKARKSGAGNCTVTAVTPGKVRGLDIADPTYTVPATTGNVYLGPWAPDAFNDAAGLVSLTLSETTGLTLEVLSVGA